LQWRQTHHTTATIQIIHDVVIIRTFLCALFLILFSVAIVVVICDIVVSHLELLLLHLQVLHLLLILLKLEVITVCVIASVRVPVIIHSHTAETYVRVIVAVHAPVVKIPALMAVPIPPSITVRVVIITILLHTAFWLPLLLLSS